MTTARLSSPPTAEGADDPSLPSCDDHGGALDGDDDDHNYDYDYDHDDNEFLERELELSRLSRTQSALLSAHQLEALWKISKIESDRRIAMASASLDCTKFVGSRGTEERYQRIWNT